MKRLNVFLLSIMMGTTVLHSQNVGISATGTPPDASAGLDVNFSDRGLLIPRVALTSVTDAATIPSPATSLLVYNTGTGGLTPAGYYYNAGTPGSPNWVKLFNGGLPGDAWLTTGNNGVSVSTHFLGTINNTGLAFRTNNIERMRLHNTGQLSIGDNAPGGKLDVHQESANDVARFITYGSTNDIRLRRTQGTKSSPSATGGASTILGRIFAEGYNGSGFTAAAAMEMSTDATGGSSTDMPGRISFWTTPDNSGTLQERMRITNNGNVGINDASPFYKLDVTADADWNGARVKGSQNTQVVCESPNGSIAQFSLFQNNLSRFIMSVAANGDYWGVGRFNNSGTYVDMPLTVNRNNGFVGVRTAYPATQLHVHDVNSTTVRITSTNASTFQGIQVGITNGWYFGTDPSENFTINRETPLGGTSTGVFRIYSTANPRMSHFLSRQSGILGNGTAQDGPTNVIIDAGNGPGRYNDWPNGWGGGLSTWDICGASTYMTGYSTRSDKRYKRNVEVLPADELLKKFMKIQPVQYYINSEALKVDDPERLRFGFIANDIEKLFPNLVINAGLPDSIARGLEYDGFIPILVKVVQMQQSKIDTQQQLIENLQQQNQILQAEIQKIKAHVGMGEAKK